MQTSPTTTCCGSSARARAGAARNLSGWASQWPFVPYVAETWTVDGVAEILQGSTGVPLAGWVELAQPLVDDLHTDYGARAR